MPSFKKKLDSRNMPPTERFTVGSDASKLREGSSASDSFVRTWISARGYWRRTSPRGGGLPDGLCATGTFAGAGAGERCNEVSAAVRFENNAGAGAAGVVERAGRLLMRACGTSTGRGGIGRAGGTGAPGELDRSAIPMVARPDDVVARFVGARCTVVPPVVGGAPFPRGELSTVSRLVVLGAAFSRSEFSTLTRRVVPGVVFPRSELSTVARLVVAGAVLPRSELSTVSRLVVLGAAFARLVVGARCSSVEREEVMGAGFARNVLSMNARSDAFTSRVGAGTGRFFVSSCFASATSDGLFFFVVIGVTPRQQTRCPSVKKGSVDDSWN